MSSEDARHRLAWEATKAFKGGLIDRSALDTIRALIKERGPDADAKVAAFAVAFLQRLGIESQQQAVGLPSAAAAGSAAAASAPATVAPCAPSLLIAKLDSTLLQQVWDFLDAPSQVSVLFVSRSLVRSLFPNVAEKRRKAASMIRNVEEDEEWTAAMRSCVSHLIPDDELNASLVFAQFLKSAHLCDDVLAQCILSKVSELRLAMVASLRTSTGQFRAGSAQSLILEDMVYEWPHLVLSFNNQANACAVVVGSSHFELRALSHDHISIGTVVAAAALMQVSTTAVRLVAVGQPGNVACGTVGITVAGPRTARFLGTVLHQNSSHYLMAGGASGEGHHGIGMYEARQVQEVVSYQRERYQVGRDMFELSTAGLELRLSPKILYRYCFGT